MSYRLHRKRVAKKETNPMTIKKKAPGLRRGRLMDTVPLPPEEATPLQVLMIVRRTIKGHIAEYLAMDLKRALGTG
jgi:hypothetical protein